MTLLIEHGEDKETEFTQKFIASFGMVRQTEELVKQEKCKHNYQVLRNDVKEAFLLISKETYNTYNSSATSVQCTNTGDQGCGTYCTYSINHFLTTALKHTQVTSQNLLRVRIWYPIGMRSKSTVKTLIGKKYVEQSCPMSLISLQVLIIANSYWGLWIIARWNTVKY